MAWLVIARVAVATIGVRRFRKGVDALAPDARASDDWPGRVRRALSRASRTIPGSTCLPQALAAYALLRRAGHPAELSIGVARADHDLGRIDAHAWVTSGALVVVGDAERDRFTPLAQAGSGP